MRTRREMAADLAKLLAQQVFDGCMEIIEIMDEHEQGEIFKVGSSHGLEVYARGRELPVAVPDSWVNEWAVYCDGNKGWVVDKVRALGQWSLDNPNRRKAEKNLRRWLGSRIANGWAERQAGRPQSMDSLKGYERKHGGD